MMKSKFFLSALLMFLFAQFTYANEKLNIYNWSDYIAEDTLEKFTKETGIEVVYDVYDSNEVLEAKMFAGNSGYDIVIPTSDFLQRQAAAGLYAKLDKSKLPNLTHMDAALMQNAAGYDEDNAHSVIYMWGTTGIGYNEAMIAERFGDSAPTDSWALVFEEENIKKLADCGVSFLDAPTEIIPAAMNYLGLDPRSTNKDDIEKAKLLLSKIAPYVRYFNSSQYINDLANGDICLSVGWSGDIFIAQARAEEANNGNAVVYYIPREGALQWFDLLAIPKDAPNKDNAHKFINFIMKPQITADITNYVWYANGNKSSMEFVDEEVKSNPAIFPTEEVKKNLWAAKVYDKKTDRTITRAWTTVKSKK